VRIGDLATKAGVSPSLLRYYEEQGLLSSTRSEAGYRIYGPDALGRLGFIKRAKALGLSLEEVRRLVQTPSPMPESLEELRHVIAHKLVDTQSRIAELEALRGELEALHVRLGRAEPPCGHLGDCGCWLPTEQEVRLMTIELRDAECCDCCPGECPCEAEGCGCTEE
jgi:MerR family transcriptional regulator, copper efflux regulator